MNRSARVSGSILERIAETKRAEVASLAGRGAELRRAAESMSGARPFAAALRGAGQGTPGVVALIAEIKRRSPSAGPIRPDLTVAEVARAYAAAGAAALSVLTDRDWFGGSLADLEAARAAVTLPVLRKDFVVDEVQIWEARAAGADAVLLIVRMLERSQLADLHAAATALGLGVLVEVHDRRELEDALAVGAQIVGVNNRDLATFRTELRTVLELAPAVPADRLLVAESGIATAADVDRLAAAGVDAILVGESLMRAPDVGAAAAALAGRPRRAGARSSSPDA